MVLSEFNSDYLTNLLDTLFSENKTVVLFGDFNSDLLQYKQNSNISGFLYLMYSSLLFPHIFSPTRTIASSATLIDNIFTINYNSAFVFGNLVNSLSNYQAQFLIMGNLHNSLEFDSTEQMFRDFHEIEKNKNIISSLLENVDLVTELRLSHNDVDLSSELFLKKVEKLIDFWAPLQIVSNKQKKLLKKPWLTSSILKSTEIKNRLHKRKCRAKDPLHKEELANKVKNCRNTILKLTQKSKANHFNKYFHDNKLNIFKTWEGIREIMNVSEKGSNNINCIQIGKNTITNSSDITNEFNRHFTSVAKQIEEKLIKPKHHYSKY